MRPTTAAICMLSAALGAAAVRFPVPPSSPANDPTWLLCGRLFHEEWYRQPLDHYDFKDTRTFQQRVLVNTDTVDWRAPVIFFYTGNEGDITLFANNTGFMCEAASEFGAALVFAEHRYFGRSTPDADLGFLSVQQALSDYAVVVDRFKASRAVPDAPVIAFGGSYGGMLSAWFRIKYPGVVDGAIAASAPILQFTGITPSDTFNDIVTRTFESSRAGCSHAIRSAFERIERTPIGTLETAFRLCKPLPGRQQLVDWISNGLAYEAMVDYPTEASFVQPLPAWPVNATCDAIMGDGCDDDPLSCFVAGVSVYFNSTGNAGPCNDIDVDSSPSLDEQGWDYLACTSMVMPMSSGPASMFPPQPWDVDAYSLACQQRFSVTPDATYAVREFGGNRLETASNIVFSNGVLDPWSGGGVLSSGNPSIVTIQIPGAAHHLDLRASDASDGAPVQEARRIHRASIRQWIRQARSRTPSMRRSVAVQ